MKKIIIFGIILLLIVGIYNIGSSILKNFQSIRTSEKLKERFEMEQAKNNFLKEKLVYVQTDEFVNQQARNQLGLVKKDEYVVLAPPPKRESLITNLAKKPNWKKWAEVLFN